LVPLTTPDEPWTTNVEPTALAHVDSAFDPSPETARELTRKPFTSPDRLVGAPQEATFPTTLAEALSNEKVVTRLADSLRRIQDAVTVAPSDEIPTRGVPEASVIAESTVVAPQFAVLPLIVAERDRTRIGATARPAESIRARAQTAVAFVPSADMAMTAFFAWNPGAERSVIPPQEVVVPWTVPVLDLTINTGAGAGFDQTTVTIPPEEDIEISGSSIQLPWSEIC
jgi:hypothetical protein